MIRIEQLASKLWKHIALPTTPTEKNWRNPVNTPKCK